MDSFEAFKRAKLWLFNNLNIMGSPQKTALLGKRANRPDPTFEIPFVLTCSQGTGITKMSPAIALQPILSSVIEILHLPHSTESCVYFSLWSFYALSHCYSWLYWRFLWKEKFSDEMFWGELPNLAWPRPNSIAVYMSTCRLFVFLSIHDFDLG